MQLVVYREFVRRFMTEDEFYELCLDEEWSEDMEQLEEALAYSECWDD